MRSHCSCIGGLFLSKAEAARQTQRTTALQMHGPSAALLTWKIAEVQRVSSALLRWTTQMVTVQYKGMTDCCDFCKGLAGADDLAAWSRRGEPWIRSGNYCIKFQLCHCAFYERNAACSAETELRRHVAVAHRIDIASSVRTVVTSTLTIARRAQALSGSNCQRSGANSIGAPIARSCQSSMTRFQ